MKRITGKEDFKAPVILLFLFSMLFAAETKELANNLDSYGSIILNEPIIFSKNIFDTIFRISWFVIPFTLIIAAIIEKNIFLKITFSLGAAPLILTTSVINQFGFKSLYYAKTLLLFIVAILLMRYLIDTAKLYQIALTEIQETDNLRL